VLAGDRASSASDIIASLAAQLQIRSVMSELAELLRRPDPLAAPPIMGRMRAWLDERSRHPTVLLDGPIDPKLSFDLFGRWRDELFAMPINWVVLGHRERLAEYLTPQLTSFSMRSSRWTL
jgi:hypothetical protein